MGEVCSSRQGGHQWPAMVPFQSRGVHFPEWFRRSPRSCLMASSFKPSAWCAGRAMTMCVIARARMMLWTAGESCRSVRGTAPTAGATTMLCSQLQLVLGFRTCSERENWKTLVVPRVAMLSACWRSACWAHGRASRVFSFGPLAAEWEPNCAISQKRFWQSRTAESLCIPEDPKAPQKGPGYLRGADCAGCRTLQYDQCE